MKKQLLSAGCAFALLGTVAHAEENSSKEQCEKEVASHITQTTYLYKLRRCIRKAEQVIANQNQADRRQHRINVHKHNQGIRSIQLQEKTSKDRQRRIEHKLDTRIGQARNVRRRNFSNTRTSRRIRVRQIESQSRAKAVKRMQMQENANKFCSNYTGSERVQCIREKVRSVRQR